MGEIRSFVMEDIYLLLIIEITLMSIVADGVKDVRRYRGEAHLCVLTDNVWNI